MQRSYLAFLSAMRGQVMDLSLVGRLLHTGYQAVAVNQRPRRRCATLTGSNPD
ncbi:MAG: hypothetical protein IIB76_11190 [Proteobacteria bacterium]|nr:hypothetical protein [Pseudomonadota bacterium]